MKNKQNGQQHSSCERAWRDLSLLDSNRFKCATLLISTADELRKDKKIRDPAIDPLPDYLKDNIAAWEEKLAAILDQCSLTELSKIIDGYAELALEPPAGFLDQWLARTRDAVKHAETQGKEALFLNNMTRIIRGIATLRIDPGSDFLNTCTEKLSDIAENATRPSLSRKFALSNMRSLTNIFWAMAVIDSRYQDNPLKEPARALAEMLQPVHLEMTLSRYQQFANACQWFDLPVPVALSELNQAETGSLLEKNVAKALQKAGADMLDEQKCRVNDLDHKVDIGVRWKGRNILVEVDGISHFLRSFSGRVRYNGDTQFQSALITKLNPDKPLLRMRHMDFEKTEKIAKGHKRLSAIRRALDQMTGASGGQHFQTDYKKGSMRIVPHAVKRGTTPP